MVTGECVCFNYLYNNSNIMVLIVNTLVTNIAGLLKADLKTYIKCVFCYSVSVGGEGKTADRLKCTRLNPFM